MARTPDVLDDPTPFEAPGVDVRVRVAWLLRMSRSAGLDGDSVSVTEMARLLEEQGVSAVAAVGLGLGDRPGRPEHRGGRGVRGRAGLRARRLARRRRPGAAHLRCHGRPDRRRSADLARPRPGRRSRARRPAGRPALDVAALLRGRAGGAARAPDRRSCARWWTALVSEPSPLRVHGVPHPVRGTRAAALRRSTPTWCPTACATTRGARQPGAWPRRMSPARRAARPADGARLLAATSAATTPGGCARRSSRLENVATCRAPDPGALAAGRGALRERLRPRRADDEDRGTSCSALWHLLPRDPRRESHRGCAGRCGPAAGTARAGPGTPSRTLAFAPARRPGLRGPGLPGQPLLARLVHEATFDRRRARSLATPTLLMASPLRGDARGEQVAATTRRADPAAPPGRRGAADRPRRPTGPRPTPGAGSTARTPPSSAPGLVALAHVGEHRSTQPRLGRLLERPDPVSRRALLPRRDDRAPGDSRGSPPTPRTRCSTGARWWLRHGPAVTS